MVTIWDNVQSWVTGSSAIESLAESNIKDLDNLYKQSEYIAAIQRKSGMTLDEIKSMTSSDWEHYFKTTGKGINDEQAKRLGKDFYILQ